MQKTRCVQPITYPALSMPDLNTMHAITITRPLATHLLGLAQKSPDAEICGLIAMRNGKPTTVYPIRNIAPDPAGAFCMDPQEQIAACKHMRTANETLFAIYHSHPHSPPIPSAEDINRIGYPGAFYLIISLNTQGVLEMCAYQLRDKKMQPITLTV